MGVQISNNKRSSTGSSSVIYKLCDSAGGTLKVFEVPVDQAEHFQAVLSSEKSRLESELGKAVTLVKVERLF